MPMFIAPYLQATLKVRSERGTALVEYALLLALIAMVCLLAVGALGTKTDAKFSSIGSSIN